MRLTTHCGGNRLESELSLERKIVGLRQSLKAIKEDRVEKVFIARDVKPEFIKDFMEICEKQKINISYVDTKEQLGQICGIERGATVACILR